MLRMESSTAAFYQFPVTTRWSFVDAASGREDRLGYQKPQGTSMNSVWCCAWSPDGFRLLSVFMTPRAGCGMPPPVKNVPQICLNEMTNNDLVEACAWSPDGSRVLIGDWSGNLKILSAADMKLVMCMAGLHGHSTGFSLWGDDRSKSGAAQWSPDGSSLALATSYVDTPARLCGCRLWTLNHFPYFQSAHHRLRLVVRKHMPPRHGFRGLAFGLR